MWRIISALDRVTHVVALVLFWMLVPICIAGGLIGSLWLIYIILMIMAGVRI